jgi:hypothetical protein
MTRKCAYLLWLAALMIVGGTQVSAQTAGTTSTGTGGTLSSTPAAEEGTGLIVTMVRAGGEDFSEQKRAGTPLGLPACTEGSIEVSVSGLPNSPQFPYLEVWYGTGQGACNQADRATRVNSAQNCTRLTATTDGQQINSFTVLNTKVQIQPVCDLNAEKLTGSKQGPQTLWFLLLRSQGSAEAAMFYRAFTINIDTVAPFAPINVNDPSGQSEIVLQWELSNSATNYWVYADYSEGSLQAEDGDAGVVGDAGAAPINCSSSYLRAGAVIPINAAAPGLLIRETDSISKAMTFDGRDFGGVKNVAVAVAAQDLAGNVGVLSRVHCITVTETTGFWDRYKSPDGADGGGLAESGCACSVPGGTRPNRSGAVLAVPVALLLVGAYARRRIRRRAR